MSLFDIAIYYRTKEEALKDKWWRGFEFNEVIGWIVLEARVGHIRAEYLLIRERPTKALVRKEFERKGKLFQVRLKPDSKRTYEALVRALEETQKTTFLSKFHLDLKTLKAVGPFLDWNSACTTAVHDTAFARRL